MTGTPSCRPRLGLGGPVGLLLLLVAFAVGGWLGWERAGPADLSRWEAAARSAAGEFGVDPSLLLAMVAVESGGRPDARSPKGARGLLQLMPATAAAEARRLGLAADDAKALQAPETNLRLGASYLSRLLARYGGEEAFALAAYNAGPSALERWRRRAPDASPLDVVLREGYDETRRYVLRVLDLRRHHR